MASEPPFCMTVAEIRIGKVVLLEKVGENVAYLGMWLRDDDET